MRPVRGRVWTVRQRALIEAILNSPRSTDEDVGKIVGLHRSTVNRLRRNPDFGAELDRRSAERSSQFFLAIMSLVPSALDVIQEKLSAGSLYAARDILDRAGLKAAPRSVESAVPGYAEPAISTLTSVIVDALRDFPEARSAVVQALHSTREENAET